MDSIFSSSKLKSKDLRVYSDGEIEEKLEIDSHHLNDDAKERKILIEQLEKMNEDKKNPIYYLNNLIINCYYSSKKRSYESFLFSKFKNKKFKQL